MPWSWRTKPRSIIKTIEWFKEFSNYNGENWDITNGCVDCRNKPIHPIRRKYIYNAHGNEDETISNLSFEQYLSGKYDETETESNARNDKATFEFFGFAYVDGGIIKVTKAGNLIRNSHFDREAFLKQLLKINFPSHASQIGNDFSENKRVFPFEIFLRIIDKFTFLNRFELAYIFSCEDVSEIDYLFNCIETFRGKYEQLENKTRDSKTLFAEVYKDYYGDITDTQIQSRYDYCDAFTRSLLYTELFSTTGRGFFTKIRVSEHAILKVKMLINNYRFVCFATDKFKDYMEWFGNVDNVVLPWENVDNRVYLLRNKLNLLVDKIREVREHYQFDYQCNIDRFVFSSTDSISKLKQIDADLTKEITNINEKVFVLYTSKTDEVRDEILNKYVDILSGNEDLAALWLECNTWKSLVAFNGNALINRNFSVEEDLTPRYFAPGKNLTPDMEVHSDEFIIVPEVSLMTGIVQWEHEASSVIEHVLKFIRMYQNKKVIGLFISSKMNVRTIWQYFILNKESWLGSPIPVIPITIEQYSDIIKYSYENELEIKDLFHLLEMINKKAIDCSLYSDWESNISNYINNWKNDIYTAIQKLPNVAEDMEEYK